MSGAIVTGPADAATKDTRKVCFVVMGFGKKTDYESGRVFDLDATYQAIIQPAVEDLGLRCIRADEIMHTGVIDRPMFEMLYRADLVIADISTGNVNAVYELGVRHALRPNCTVVMKEDQGRLYFDLDHVNTFSYAHLGEDIGHREAQRARRDLGLLIGQVLETGQVDSPVYTHMPTLQGPRLSDEAYAELLDDVEAMQEKLAGLIRAGQAAMKASQPGEAAVAFAAAATLKPDEPYIVQQLALATYKAEVPSKLDALIQAWTILAPLTPDESNDPETLGLAGAIRKRLFTVAGDIEQLHAAIRYYTRGFEIRRDYYNGENLATLFDQRASLQPDPNEAQFDRMSARKTRETLVGLLKPLIASAAFEERGDRRWVHATLANALFALGDDKDGEVYETAFLAEEPADWEITSYREGKAAMLANRSPA